MNPESWARTSVTLLIVALTAGAVYLGFPFWAAILIAVIAVVFNSWVLAIEDRDRPL
jgi:hypothetical protein